MQCRVVIVHHLLLQLIATTSLFLICCIYHSLMLLYAPCVYPYLPCVLTYCPFNKIFTTTTKLQLSQCPLFMQSFTTNKMYICVYIGTLWVWLLKIVHCTLEKMASWIGCIYLSCGILFCMYQYKYQYLLYTCMSDTACRGERDRNTAYICIFMVIKMLYN